jgi:hypothetical protein
MSTLLDLQTRMMGALLRDDPAAAADLLRGDGDEARRRIAIHANNARTNFLDSLRSSFPAVRRLVGDEYFDQCAAGFRDGNPSRSGDLQFAGDGFAPYLARLHAGGRHAYLGDVARFEWLYQESLTAPDHAPFDPARLAGIGAEQADRLLFRLHPAVRLFASPFPILEIWDANVGDAGEPPLIDLDKGADRVLLARTLGRVRCHRLSAGEHAFLEAIALGRNLAGALEAAVADRAATAPFDAGAALRRFALAGAIIDAGRA